MAPTWREITAPDSTARGADRDAQLGGLGRQPYRQRTLGTAAGVRSLRSACGGGLEQFDEIAGRVGQQDLLPARTGDRVAAEHEPRLAEPVDFGVQVVDDQVDAVTSGG